MPEYLAKISGKAFEYGFGWILPYEVNKNFRFEADNEELAKEQANQRLSKLRSNLLEPDIYLESLLEVKTLSIDS